MSKRKYIELSKIALHTPQEIQGSPEYDWGKSFHVLKGDGSFEVNEVTDGKTTQEHIDGIAYIKTVLESGAKILPPLVFDNQDGTYSKVDGFKRLMAYKELGYRNVECFVTVNPDDRQSYKDYPNILEGGESTVEDDVMFLARGESLRLEWRENIHMHFGKGGRWRFALGLKDFNSLHDMFQEIDKEI